MTQPPATEPVNQKRRRFGETTKFVPVIFVAFVIGTLQGLVQFVIFNFLTTMLMICYVRSIMVHPGEVPDNDAQWEFIPTDGPVTQDSGLNLQESKKSGDRRYCKWCSKYKPDRCHHCRICKMCILKMDHHCPWIYNCVGFNNYKLFFLLLIYSMLTLHFIVWTMGFVTVKRVILADTPFVVLFLVFFGETMALFFAVLVTTFLGFHIWLVSRAMTTIEFCEKSLPKRSALDKEAAPKKTYDASVYDMGILGNFRAILGTSPIMMFIPVGNQQGDGLTFVSEETRLSQDIEGSKGIRVKGHRNTQRRASRMPGQRTSTRAGGYGGANDSSP